MPVAKDQLKCASVFGKTGLWLCCKLECTKWKKNNTLSVFKVRREEGQTTKSCFNSGPEKEQNRTVLLESIWVKYIDAFRCKFRTQTINPRSVFSLSAAACSFLPPPPQVKSPHPPGFRTRGKRRDRQWRQRVAWQQLPAAAGGRTESRDPPGETAGGDERQSEATAIKDDDGKSSDAPGDSGSWTRTRSTLDNEGSRCSSPARGTWPWWLPGHYGESAAASSRWASSPLGRRPRWAEAATRRTPTAWPACTGQPEATVINKTGQDGNEPKGSHWIKPPPGGEFHRRCGIVFQKWERGWLTLPTAKWQEENILYQ